MLPSRRALAAAVPKNRPRILRGDGQIGMSICRAGALRDVESRDRTATAPQFQVSEVFEPCDRFDRFGNTAADQNLSVLRLGANPEGEVAYGANGGVAGAVGKADLA
jgi:hypothetical protein